MRTAGFKLHYFLLYAVVGAYLPYVPVFLGHDLVLQDPQIGWVVGGYGLAVLLAPPRFRAPDPDQSGPRPALTSNRPSCAPFAPIAPRKRFSSSRMGISSILRRY